MTTSAERDAELDRLRRIVVAAWEATTPVAELVEPQTREEAFKLLLEALLSERDGFSEDVDPAGESHSASGSTAAWPVAASQEQRIDALSAMFGIEREDVADLFDVSEPEPKLVVEHGKLSRQSAKAVREITLLVCAARDALRLGTPTKLIRDTASEFRRLDGPNFMTTIRSMKEVAVRGKPRSQQTTLRLRLNGLEAAQTLAQELTRDGA